ncbi:prepilin peptidase [Lampropedia puyangensis]|uniref:Prepilin peptidase n=1 Tax=Lampropedia puyangensis TaxID=1330072 RepID=A0A4S8EYH0_9BURK|nr:prepilin peptidase [Lampropedia puyangensis]THT99967.1 prepilin peptidase [Lampropedia puyangensis]
MLFSLLPYQWLLWLIAIAVMDLRIRKVRNWMVLVGLATGAWALFSGVQPFQVSPWDGLSGMLVAFVALLPFYALGWMGAGDVKFAAVVGLWLGLTPQLLAIWLGGSLLAGLHSSAVLGWAFLQQRPLGLWLQAHAGAWAQRENTVPLRLNFTQRNRARSIPYAGYMAIAAIVLMAYGPA